MEPVKWTTKLAIKLMRLLMPMLAPQSTEPSSGEVREINTSAGKTRIFIFKPKAIHEEPLPVYVSMHGSGFVMMSAGFDNSYCEETASAVGCLVVNIEYKLAPEYRFPVALEECYDVVKWISDHAQELHIDKDRIAIGGHSAGGNFAAAVCLLARQRKEFTVRYQILDYPPLDLTRDPASKTRVPPGSMVIPPMMARLFDECYIGTREAARNPLVSPVCEKDLRGLPPALVITAECDSLAEEAELYAKMLKDAGVEVIQKQFAGAAHGFTSAPGEQSQAAWELMHQQLKKAFAK